MICGIFDGIEFEKKRYSSSDCPVGFRAISERVVSTAFPILEVYCRGPYEGVRRLRETPT